MTRVVIVGAGVIGLFCALRLAQRGARVVVLEAEREENLSQFGPMASLAAAGMLAPLTEMGAAQHPLLGQLGLSSFDLWRSQAKGALWEEGLRFDGGIYIGADEAAAVALQRAAALLGRAAQPLNPKQWRKHSGFSAPIAHALLVEEEGIADPVRVLSGLAMDARRHGVRLLYDHDVDTVEANRVTVFQRGVFEADVVVLAPGAWANASLQGAAPALKHLRPARGHMVPVALARPLGANVHGDDFYLARRLGDDAVLGSTLEFDTHSRRAAPARVAELLATAELVLPGEVRARADRRPWAGIRPMSPDEAPLVGRSGAALLACGHSRNGWLLAPVTAEMICAHVFSDPLPPLWAAFTPDRFEAST